MAFEETQRHIEEEDLLYSHVPVAEVKKEKQDKPKSLAFKAILDVNEESSEEEDGDNEIALMTRNFNKYLKFNKRKTGSPFGQKKDSTRTRKMIQCQDASDVNPRST